MVLSVSMILMIIGLSALLAVRIQRRGAEGGNDLGAASLYAQSAIELGMHWIESDSTWRTSRGEGYWAVNQPIGEGSFSLEANDLGSNKLLEASADTDSVLLTGTGFKSDARYKLQVTLTAQKQALSCLEVALHAGTIVDLDSATVQCNQTISANDSITAVGASGTSDLEAVNSITPGGIVGQQTTGITPRVMPDSTVFDYYLTNGTTIDFVSIPSGTIFRALLSPASNPYGPTTNPDGIYVIDCGGAKIMVKSSRIVGTLVVLNPRSDSGVWDTIHWEPAVANYPALLVNGVISFNFQNTTLSEATQGTNFNPPGTPYEGVEDTDMLDSYPSLIKGLVYVSGNADVSRNHPAFDGVLVVGNRLTVGRYDIDLTYQPTYFDNPPPGFAAPLRMIISPASWRQVVN